MSTRIVLLHDNGEVNTFTGWGPLSRATGKKQKSLCDMYSAKRQTQTEEEKRKPVTISGLTIIKCKDNNETR